MSETVVVIGASGSVGRCLCQQLASKGQIVVAAVRNLKKANALSELTECNKLQVEATDWTSVESLVKQAIEQHGVIDGMAVCVGSILLKPAHLTRPEEYEQVIQQNLIPCLATMRSVARPMMKNGGSLVFVSSAVAGHGFPNHEAIAAAKAGIEGLTRSAASTYASSGIRVNCVAPGLVDSEMAQRIVGNTQALQASEQMHALGRIDQPEEVARAIAWLLDSEQSWVTGQVIGVDGGLGSLRSKNG